MVAVLIAAIALPPATVQYLPMPPPRDQAEFNETFAEATWEFLPISSSATRPVVGPLATLTENAWWRALADCVSSMETPEGISYWPEGDGMRLYIARGDELFDPSSQAQDEFYRCVVQHPRDLEGSLIFSDERIAYQYEYLRSWVGPCLTIRGYEFEPLPSWRDFVEMRGLWSPYFYQLSDAEGTLVETSDGFRDVIATCGTDFPGIPPAVFYR